MRAMEVRAAMEADKRQTVTVGMRNLLEDISGQADMVQRVRKPAERTCSQ